MRQRADFMFSSGNVKLIDGPKGIYMVTNEKDEVHMVKLLRNSCTCFAKENCASHIGMPAVYG